MIAFCVDIRKSSVIRKLLTYRDKTKFEDEKLIDNCILQISNIEKRCECMCNSHNDNSESFVNCYSERCNKMLSDSYNEKCPITEKQIVTKGKTKWFNKELLEAK